MLGDILLPNVAFEHSGSYFQSKLECASEAMIANATYFGNAQWAQEYLDYCHRDSYFKSRWLAAGGDWTGKVVIVGVYRAARYGFHKTVNQQSWGLRTEVHHRPGDDVTKEFFRSTLEPLGFDVGVYPHNHQIGAEALSGVVGAVKWKYRLGNMLSGRRASSPTSALLLMCVARRRGDWSSAAA